MSKPPSIETQLRTVKRELADMTRQRDRFRQQAFDASKFLAETLKERDEWVKRFDALLARTPTLSDGVRHE